VLLTTGDRRQATGNSPSRFPNRVQCGHDTTVAAPGVIQQRALNGRRGSFHALSVVRADDRFHGFLGLSSAIASATKRNVATTRC
jgi:hypothetical protein